MIPNDAELLRRFSREGSQPAFAELVRRHLNLVYSVALRRLGGDPHGAADVTQGVFIDVARKAGSLSHHPVLTGWLYTSTRYAADQTARAERRRRVREQQAFMMQELNDEAGADAEWQRLRTVLDDAMGELDEPERTAILLRFFENRPFAEIGQALELSEEAARKRVTRGLGRLESLLIRRGLGSTGAVATLISTRAVVAAPAGLAAQVGRATVEYAGAGARIMATTQKVASVVVAIALGLAGIALIRKDPPIPSPALSNPPPVERSIQPAVPSDPAPLLVEAPQTAPVVPPPPAPVPIAAPEPKNPLPDLRTERLSIDFPNEDSATILRNIAALYRFELVLPDSLRGKTSLRVTNASLERIFQKVLIPSGYTFAVDGRLIRVFPFSDEQSYAAALDALNAQNIADMDAEREAPSGR